MFNENTDGFDVFEESSVGDFSAYTNAEIQPRAGQKRHHASTIHSHSSSTSSTCTRAGQNPLGFTTTKDADREMADNMQDHDMDADDTNPQSKKPRSHSPMPTVTDSFESELVQEIDVASNMLAVELPSQERHFVPHKVRHDVALPPNWDYVPLSQHIPLEPPAKIYPFELDEFQKLAKYSIERKESVLVSAHTSAGKTVVAEYAIATCLRDMQRVIYTSPIKALSNQKFRELQEEFQDVGLMTGDVTVNPNASCLVMTTEILRGMLYMGSEVVRELAWVVFDEIHYMKDSERGVVWEETIILLPPQCHYVFLSATIPNAMEFAEWICKIKQQPCHVVYTDFRPTPLQHYLFPEGGNGLHLVVDEKGQFREDNFKKAVLALEEAGGGSAGKKRKDAGPKAQPKGLPASDISTDGPSDIYRIVRAVIMKAHHPVIVFSFSKRECEAYAMEVMDLSINSETEAVLVANVFNKAMDSLSEKDRKLPQISRMLPLLQKGIGFHHGGLLPILKEVIEILFQEGLLKLLFATETFSIGLNMPAKTVVFTSVQKFDGTKNRFITGGEYIQMSGRAGRRGLDKRGFVTLMLNAKMEPSVAKGMVLGTADPLDSAFHLSYTMILNMLRVEGITPELIMEKSFYQFQNSVHIPQMQKELARLELDRNTCKVQDEESVEGYHNIRLQLESLARSLRAIINQPPNVLPYLKRGRPLRIRIDNQDLGWGVLHSVNKRRVKGGQQEEELTYIANVLLNCAPDTAILTDVDGFATGVKACPEGVNGELLLVPVSLAHIEFYGMPMLLVPNQQQWDLAKRQLVYRYLQQLQKLFPDGIPLIDPIEDMKIQDRNLQVTVRRIEVLERVLYEHPLEKAGFRELARVYGSYLRRVELSSQIKTLKKKIGRAFSAIQMDELKARKRVLRRLGFISTSDVIELKGRVACEIKSGDDALLLTELMFSGVFSEWSVPQTVALMSCFCFQEKLRDAPTTMPEELATPLRVLQETAREIGRIQVESKVEGEENAEDYVQKFKPDVMAITYAWANGASFADIMKMTDAFEGSVVRTLRSLDELLRQMAEAAKSVGNLELVDKFTAGSVLIKRDIVFAASLYL
ncbi:ATP-dependent RNA helicase mtr4 [Mortierella alpina]|nr:ATP-dependent RNA helicase mtr4 [Mortierella alpina]